MLNPLANLTLKPRDYRHFRVEPRTPVIGGWIEGLHLSEINDEIAEDLRDALWTYGVLFGRKQNLSFDAMKQVARVFGDQLEKHSFAATMEAEGHPEVVVIQKLQSDKAKNTTDIWHHDVTARKHPNIMSILQADQVPFGADTMWSSMTAASPPICGPSPSATPPIARKSPRRAIACSKPPWRTDMTPQQTSIIAANGFRFSKLMTADIEEAIAADMAARIKRERHKRASWMPTKPKVRKPACEWAQLSPERLRACKAQIMSILTTEFMPAAEVCAELRFSTTSIRSALIALQNEGKIERIVTRGGRPSMCRKVPDPEVQP